MKWLKPNKTDWDTPSHILGGKNEWNKNHCFAKFLLKENILQDKMRRNVQIKKEMMGNIQMVPECSSVYVKAVSPPVFLSSFLVEFTLKMILQQNIYLFPISEGGIYMKEKSRWDYLHICLNLKKTPKCFKPLEFFPSDDNISKGTYPGEGLQRKFWEERTPWFTSGSLRDRTLDVWFQPSYRGH